MSVKKKTLTSIAVVCCAAVLLIVFFVNAREIRRKNISPDGVISNSDAVIASIRQGLRDHSARMTVTFSYDRDILSEIPRFVNAWMAAAVEETGSPVEGDYIRYQCGGYESTTSCDRADGSYTFTVQIVPQYYMYLAQEEAVTEKLWEIFDGFGFDGDTSDYDKIRAIYDYMCSRVKYDKIHVKNKYYCLRSTSYAALIQETATCQGYSVALYRMLRQAGINARIITGIGHGENFDGFHAWNIAQLDGVYYNLDATWDAGKDEYSYFLKGKDGFTGHVPGEEFTANMFMEQYPISETNFVFPIDG